MRLFIALWPSPEVVEVLDGLARPEHPSVRWTAREQWHVTLRFLGDVAEDELPALVEALGPIGSRPARRATMGPATARLGRNVLMVPVASVDDLGQAVLDATRPFGSPAEDREFTAHLTLARRRGRQAVPAHLAGDPVEAAWPVTEVALVRSHLGSAGARYETIAAVPLAPGLPNSEPPRDRKWANPGGDRGPGR